MIIAVKQRLDQFFYIIMANSLSLQADSFKDETMSEQLSDKFKDNELLRKRFLSFSEECIIPAKTSLLEAGTVSKSFYFVKQGCLRLWFNSDGKDITFQFFFEGQGVASIESYMRNVDSQFSIETIEPSVILKCSKEKMSQLMEEFPELKEWCDNFIIDRLINYTHLFLSRIKDSPTERYRKLTEEHPQIIQRIPQHYIASYLGITPVSLSRIRNRR